MTSSKLIRLKLKNYRSFYSEQNVIFDTDDSHTVTAIYGPNASGKSNVVNALRFMQWFVINSNNANMTEIPHDPFLLKEHSATEPSEFEIEFKHSQRHFIYGFGVTRKAVECEYLHEYASKTKKPRVIFERKKGVLNASAEKYSFGKKLFETTRVTALLITKGRENNNEYSNLIFDWFSCANILHGDPAETMSWTIQNIRQDPSMRDAVLDFLKQADFWIRSFKFEQINLPEQVLAQLPFVENLKEQIKSSANDSASVKTSHVIRDSKQRIIGERDFDMGGQESSGTQKFFALAAPIIDTLRNGKVLYLDEFESYLHPDLCRFIVATFKSKRNAHGAQLIINTHDTGLMSKDGPLAREDILFVEKNYAEESVVHALTAQSVRTNESFEKRYRQGLYGAKPQVRFEEE